MRDEMKTEEQKAWRPSSSEESGVVGEVGTTHNHDVFGSEEHHDVCAKDASNLSTTTRALWTPSTEYRLEQSPYGTRPKTLLDMSSSLVVSQLTSSDQIQNTILATRRHPYDRRNRL